MDKNSELLNIIEEIQEINTELSKKASKASIDASLNSVSTNNLIVGTIGNIVEVLDLASQTTHGRMSREDKIKLDGIEEGATNYKHPDTHPAPMIVQDKDHRFVTDEQIEFWNKFPSLYIAQKTDLSLNDLVVIENYFKENTDKTPIDSDVFIIESIVNEIVYEKSAYYFNNSKWNAMTGCVDADKVIMRSNIKGAGNWDRIGNFTKSLNGTVDIPTNGKSVMWMFNEIFSQRLQPTSITQPSVSGFALSGAKAVEAGTFYSSLSFGTAKLNAGSYQYGPEPTGVVANSYTVNRICTPSNLSLNSVASAASGTDNNGGNGFIIGDDTSVGNNVVSSIKYTVSVQHSEGSIAYDNLGSNSNPIKRIEAGTKSQTTSAYTPFRKFFYGSTTNKPVVDSSYIRGLTNSTAAYKAQTLTLNVQSGASRVVIACIGTVTGVTKVINETALNADITSVFVKSTVQVSGANNYAPKSYNVWIFEPAVPFENAAVLKVTLG